MGYFSICISVALTFFAIIAGFLLAWLRRWKASHSWWSDIFYR